MIRVAICSIDTRLRGALQDETQLLASQLGIAQLETGAFASAAQLAGELARYRSGFCDLAICQVEAAHADEKAQVQALAEAHPQLNVVVASYTPEAALTAYQLGAVGFLPLAGGAQALARVASTPLREAAEKRRACVALKSQKGIDVLELETMLFAESSRKGPLIHLSGGNQVATRGTLQALFDQLSPDRRFAKAGSSFIVNLDNVRSAGESSVVFPGGEVIIVPIRARKPLRDALDAYREGRTAQP